MQSKNAIGNLINRYKAVLKKCNLMNTFGSLAVAGMLALGGLVMPVGSLAADVMPPAPPTVPPTPTRGADGTLKVNGADFGQFTTEGAFTANANLAKKLDNDGHLYLVGVDLGTTHVNKIYSLNDILDQATVEDGVKAGTLISPKQVRVSHLIANGATTDSTINSGAQLTLTGTASDVLSVGTITNYGKLVLGTDTTAKLTYFGGNITADGNASTVTINTGERQFVALQDGPVFTTFYSMSLNNGADLEVKSGGLVMNNLTLSNTSQVNITSGISESNSAGIQIMGDSSYAASQFAAQASDGKIFIDTHSWLTLGQNGDTATISGGGDLTLKQGAKLVFGGNVTFEGETTLKGGTIAFGDGTMSGGKLIVDDASSLEIEALRVVTAASSPIEIKNGSLNIYNYGYLSAGANITLGDGGTLSIADNSGLNISGDTLTANLKDFGSVSLSNFDATFTQGGTVLGEVEGDEHTRLVLNSGLEGITLLDNYDALIADIGDKIFGEAFEGYVTLTGYGQYRTLSDIAESTFASEDVVAAGTYRYGGLSFFAGIVADRSGTADSTVNGADAELSLSGEGNVALSEGSITVNNGTLHLGVTGEVRTQGGVVKGDIIVDETVGATAKALSAGTIVTVEGSTQVKNGGDFAVTGDAHFSNAFESKGGISIEGENSTFSVNGTLLEEEQQYTTSATTSTFTQGGGAVTLDGGALYVTETTALQGGTFTVHEGGTLETKNLALSNDAHIKVTNGGVDAYTLSLGDGAHIDVNEGGVLYLADSATFNANQFAATSTAGKIALLGANDIEYGGVFVVNGTLTIDATEGDTTLHTAGSIEADSLVIGGTKALTMVGGNLNLFGNATIDGALTLDTAVGSVESTLNVGDLSTTGHLNIAKGALDVDYGQLNVREAGLSVGAGSTVTLTNADVLANIADFGTLDLTATKGSQFDDTNAKVAADFMTGVDNTNSTVSFVYEGDTKITLEEYGDLTGEMSTDIFDKNVGSLHGKVGVSISGIVDLAGSFLTDVSDLPGGFVLEEADQTIGIGDGILKADHSLTVGGVTGGDPAVDKITIEGFLGLTGFGAAQGVLTNVPVIVEKGGEGNFGYGVVNGGLTNKLDGIAFAEGTTFKGDVLAAGQTNLFNTSVEGDVESDNGVTSLVNTIVTGNLRIIDRHSDPRSPVANLRDVSIGKDLIIETNGGDAARIVSDLTSVAGRTVLEAGAELSILEGGMLKSKELLVSIPSNVFATLNVGSPDTFGVVAVDIVNAKGLTAWVEPSWIQGQEYQDAATASKVAFGEFVGGKVNGNLLAGQNAQIALGTNDPNLLTSHINAMGQVWGSAGITAALGIYAPQTLDAAGAIYVDGAATGWNQEFHKLSDASGTVLHTVAGNNAVFASKSLFVVDVAGVGEGNTALTGTGTSRLIVTGETSATANDGSKLYFTNLSNNMNIVLVDSFLDSTGGVLEKADMQSWVDNTYFEGGNFAGDLVFGANGKVSILITSIFDAADYSPYISHPSSVYMNDYFKKYGLGGDLDSGPVGSRFIANAFNSEAGSGLGTNNPKLAIATIEGAAHLGAVANVADSSMNAVEAAGGAIWARNSLTGMGDNASKPVVMMTGKGSINGGSSLDGGVNGGSANVKSGIAAWLMPLYKWNTAGGFSAGNLEHGYEGGLGGIAFGVDYTHGLSEDSAVRFGLALNVGAGYSESSGDFNKTNNSFDFWGLSAYGALQKGNFVGTLDVGFSSVSSEISQNVPSTMGMGNLDTNISSLVFTAGLNLEYTFATEFMNITPHVGVRFMNVSSQEYDINSSAGLVGMTEEENQSVWYFPLGVTFSKDIVTSGGWTFTPKLDVGFIAAAGDLNARSSTTFTGVPGTLELEMQNVDGFAFNGGAGFELSNAQNGVSVGLNYNLQLSEHETGHMIFANFKYEF